MEEKQGWAERGLIRFSQPVVPILCSAVACQMYEDDEALGPFDQRTDGRPLPFSYEKLVFSRPTGPTHKIVF
ncbi:hypothetical protein AB0N24_22715 [Arthrobacter sp. NPDC093128]|uniref:hypothetical protein n=1 Tax=Arthrobacter sp. NPDC093128 TaxID=3154979 RepID=UPI003441F24D